MLKTRKTISALIALVLSVLMLASCASTSSNGSSEAPLELTVWNTQGQNYVFKDLERDIPNEWLTEKTGVSVQNIYGNDGGQWDSKLTKLVAGDNLPDIVWCQSSQGPAHFNKLLSLERLSLLTEDMLKKYAPNIWKRTPSHVWDAFKTEDGKITGIPYTINASYIDTIYYDLSEEERKNLSKLLNPASSVQTNLYIRDDILKMIYPECKSYDEIMALLEERQAPIGDEVMDIPIHSTEELIEFMYKIRDLNLTENGRKVYAFGYAGDGNDNWESLVYLGNLMYGSNWHQYTAHWNSVTEKIEIPLMTDFIKEMARTQNQLILDNVIDPESLAHVVAQFKAKIFQGVYAICSANRGAGSIDLVNKQIESTGATFRYRPFWLDIPAPEGYEPFTLSSNFTNSFCILNTLSEEEVIRVLKWADLQYTDEFMEIRVWGRPEDGLYVDHEDGTRTYVDENFNKRLIYGDNSALDDAKSMGLGGIGTKFIITPMTVSRYSPTYMNNYVRLTPSPSTGLKFSPDSKYITSVKNFPPSYAYSSEFSHLPDVINYWSRRDQWETAIKKAIAAPEGQFDAKWAEVHRIVNDVCDYKQMEKDMTEVALPYWENIKAAEKANK